MCEGSSTPLPSHVPLPQRKPRSGGERRTRSQAELIFHLFEGELVLFTQAERGFTQNLPSQQMNSCTRPQTCELLPSTTACSFPNTSEEPQPMANRWKTSESLTESQPYPKARELSSLQKQQNRNEFWDQNTDG